jgi:DNA polymerase III subunit alpha
MGISQRMTRRFVSLHSHSTFSYGDGFGPVQAHVDRIAELGGSALALTEHGNVSSWVQLEKAAKAKGIKPLFGLEAYTAPPKEQRKFHQIILAENLTGLRNLNTLVGLSYAEGFYRWPTIHGTMLRDHAEGLIVTSGCADSLLSCTLAGGKSMGLKRQRISSWDLDNAEKVVRRFQSLFGDGYYLEVQRFPGLDRTRLLNPALAELSRKTGVPLVATADVHYPYARQNEMQKILHAAHRGATVEKAEAGWEYDILLTYPTSDAEVYNDLINTGLTRSQAWQAVLATEEIAGRCNVQLPKNEVLRFPVPDGLSANEYLWEILREGWRYRIRNNARMQGNPDEYVARLRYEMALIEEKDFSDYFLMVSDAVRFAKDLRPRPIPVGPARGSAAASLVCYISRITEVDPLGFPTMVFERFIDRSRLDLPDIDLDFADTRREEVHQYLVRRYGDDRVASIGNFVKYRGRNSVVDVARVYNIPKRAEDAVKSVVLDRSGGDSRADDSLADSIAMFPSAKAAVAEFPALWRAVELEGNMRSMSVHAAGIVISNRPIKDTCAVYTRELHGKPRSVLAYDKKDAEAVGMLKMDFLGLSTMGMIDIVLEMVGMDLAELYNVPLDERRTLDAFRRGDVVGIFQFEGRATRLVNAGVVPDHFMHLADINALARPGPLFSGMTAQYIDIKHGRKKPDHLHPIVWKYTEFTYGQIIYQEQVLSIVREMGGFPVERIGDIRRAISQKLGEAHMNNMREMFISGARRLHKVDEKLADRIWKFMVTSATYSFNVAHCVSYSMLGFWCQYLKQYYPREFYAAQLQKVGDTKKARESRRPRLLVDAVKNGYKILPPDPRYAGLTWLPDKWVTNGIHAGLLQIPKVGVATAQAMLDHREQFKVLHWNDFAAVKGVGPTTIMNMEKFAETDDPFDIELTARVLDEIRHGIANGWKDYRGFPRPTHRSHEIPRDRDCRVVWIGIVRKIEYKDLIEDERARSGDSVEDIIKRTKDPKLVKSVTLHCSDDGDDDVYLRINRWRFPDFRERVEQILPGETVVICTGLKKASFGVSLQVERLIVLAQEEDEEEEDDVAG